MAKNLSTIIIGDSQLKYLAPEAVCENCKIYSVSGMMLETIPSDALQMIPQFSNVVIHIGTNHSPWDIPAQFEIKYYKLLKQIRLMNPRCFMFVSGILPRMESQFCANNFERLNEKALVMNLYLSTVIERFQGAFFINNWESFAMRTLLSRDGLHLTPDGIQMLASNLREVLFKYSNYLSPHNCQFNPSSRRSSPSSHCSNPSSCLVNPSSRQFIPSSHRSNPSPRQFNPSSHRSSPSSHCSNPSSCLVNPSSRQFSPSSHRSNPSPRQFNPSSHRSNPFFRRSSPCSCHSNPSSCRVNPSSRHFSPSSHRSNLSSRWSNLSSHRSDPFFRRSNPSSHWSNPSPHQFNPSSHRSNLSSHWSNPSSHRSNPSSHRSNPSAHQFNPSSHRSNLSSHWSNPSSHRSNPFPRQFNPSSHRSSPSSCRVNPSSRQFSLSSHRSNPSPRQFNPSYHRSNPSSCQVNPSPCQFNPSSRCFNPSPRQLNPSSSQVNPSPCQFIPFSRQSNPSSHWFNRSSPHFNPSYHQSNPSPRQFNPSSCHLIYNHQSNLSVHQATPSYKSTSFKLRGGGAGEAEIIDEHFVGNVGGNRLYPRVCGKCQRMYENKSSFSRHKKTCNTLKIKQSSKLYENGRTCDICNQIYKSRSSFSLHKKVCKSVNKCNTCSKLFHSEILYNAHKKVCRLTCNDCSLTYRTKQLYLNHKRYCPTLKSKRFATCVEPSCNLKFPSHISMMLHMKSEHASSCFKMLEFPNMDAFESWKDQLHVESHLCFVRCNKLSANKKKYIRYVCQFGLKRNKNCHTKTQRRRQFGTIPQKKCPAKLLVCIKDAKVIVKYISIHSHKSSFKDTKWQRLPSSLRTNIQHSLNVGISPTKILDSLQDGQSRAEKYKGSPKASHFISMKQIRQLSYQTKSLKHLHPNDAISISCWVQNHIDSVLVYKPQGAKTEVGICNLDDLPNSQHLFAIGIQRPRQFEELR